MPRIKVYRDHDGESIFDFYFDYKEGFYKNDVEVPQDKYDAMLKNANEWMEIQNYLRSLHKEQTK